MLSQECRAKSFHFLVNIWNLSPNRIFAKWHIVLLTKTPSLNVWKALSKNQIRQTTSQYKKGSVKEMTEKNILTSSHIPQNTNVKPYLFVLKTQVRSIDGIFFVQNLTTQQIPTVVYLILCQKQSGCHQNQGSTEAPADCVGSRTGYAEDQRSGHAHAASHRSSGSLRYYLLLPVLQKVQNPDKINRPSAKILMVLLRN